MSEIQVNPQSVINNLSQKVAVLTTENCTLQAVVAELAANNQQLSAELTTLKEQKEKQLAK